MLQEINFANVENEVKHKESTDANFIRAKIMKFASTDFYVKDTIGFRLIKPGYVEFYVNSDKVEKLKIVDITGESHYYAKETFNDLIDRNQAFKTLSIEAIENAYDWFEGRKK